MTALRTLKVLVLVLAMVTIFAGAFTIVSTENVQAAPKCCIWVMYCTTTPPIVCWEVCRPVPCL
jgi:hypothetical protein